MSAWSLARDAGGARTRSSASLTKLGQTLATKVVEHATGAAGVSDEPEVTASAAGARDFRSLGEVLLDLLDCCRGTFDLVEQRQQTCRRAPTRICRTTSGSAATRSLFVLAFDTSSRSSTRQSGSSVGGDRASRDSHSVDLILELFLPPLAIAARFPVFPAGRLEFLFKPLRPRFPFAAGCFQARPASSSAHPARCPGSSISLSSSARSSDDFAVFQFLLHPRLQDRRVGDQSLGDVEAKERLDRRAQTWLLVSSSASERIFSASKKKSCETSSGKKSSTSWFQCSECQRSSKPSSVTSELLAHLAASARSTTGGRRKHALHRPTRSGTRARRWRLRFR